MAHHSHRLKRMRQNKKNHLRNLVAKRTVKKAIKQLLLLVKEKNGEEAKISLNKVTSLYATTAKRGIISKDKSSRQISKLTKKVNALSNV